MEQIKTLLDSSLAFLGVVAAVIAAFSWYAGKKLDFEKAIEEEKLKTRVYEANAEAEIARQQAAAANESIIKTNLRTREVESNILKQKEKASMLSLQLEKQKEIAAIAQIELFKLKNKITPRSIPLNILGKFVKNLKHSEYKSISIMTEMGDDESYFFAKNVLEAFDSAGWNARMGTTIFTLRKKVLIITHYNNINAALKLQNDFRDAGFNFEIENGPKPEEGDKYLNISIGSRN